MYRAIKPILLWNKFTNNYTPHEKSSGGYIGITLSVRLSVRPYADSCPALTLAYHIWHMGVPP